MQTKEPRPPDPPTASKENLAATQSLPQPTTHHPTSANSHWTPTTHSPLLSISTGEPNTKTQLPQNQP